MFCQSQTVLYLTGSVSRCFSQLFLYACYFLISVGAMALSCNCSPQRVLLLALKQKSQRHRLFQQKVIIMACVFSLRLFHLLSQQILKTTTCFQKTILLLFACAKSCLLQISLKRRIPGRVSATKINLQKNNEVTSGHYCFSVFIQPSVGR